MNNAINSCSNNNSSSSSSSNINNIITIINNNNNSNNSCSSNRFVTNLLNISTKSCNKAISRRNQSFKKMVLIMTAAAATATRDMYVSCSQMVLTDLA